LFEGDGKASTQENKRYLKAFSQKETRYVWSDFRFKNKVHSDYYALKYVL
jgi:hypothetical protein